MGANPGKEKIAQTAAGQAQAKAEVLRKRDLGAGWRGGAKKPDLSSTMPGCRYRPKQSDLTLIGAAETDWRNQVLVVQSEAQVLKTARMVRVDWRRTVLAPQVMPCLRRGLVKSLHPGQTLISFRRVAFPRLATFTRAYRVVTDVKTDLGKARLELDLVVFGVGRNELTLTVTGLAAIRTAARRAEVQLGRLLVARAVRN